MAGKEIARDVAVVIPAFNASGTIARAVRSALAEPEVAEVVVVDDGSRDGTGDVVAACNDGSGRLQLITQANAGPSAAFNRGIETSSAPLVCRLDADDMFARGRFAAIFARAGEDWDMVADKVVMAEFAETDGLRCWTIGEGLSSMLDFTGFVLGNIADPRQPHTELGFLQPLVRRDFLERHRLRSPDGVRLGEDFLFCAQALALGARFRIVDHSGYIAIQRPDSLSHVHSTEDLGALLAAERVLARELVDPVERHAFARHIRHIKHKYKLRLALDAKQCGDLVKVAKIALSDWGAARYMVSETLRTRQPHRRPLMRILPSLLGAGGNEAIRPAP